MQVIPEEQGSALIPAMFYHSYQQSSWHLKDLLSSTFPLKATNEKKTLKINKTISINHVQKFTMNHTSEKVKNIIKKSTAFSTI